MWDLRSCGCRGLSHTESGQKIGHAFPTTPQLQSVETQIIAGKLLVFEKLVAARLCDLLSGEKSLSDTNTMNYGTTLPARAWGRCDLMIPSASWRLLWYLTLRTWSAALFHVRVSLSVLQFTGSLHTNVKKLQRTLLCSSEEYDDCKKWH